MDKKNQSVGGLFFRKIAQKDVIRFTEYWIQTSDGMQGKAQFNTPRGQWEWTCTWSRPDGKVTGIFEIPIIQDNYGGQ